MINPVEAVRVKIAFLMAANGYEFTEIAQRLNQLEEQEPTRKEWNSRIVKRLLTSEAYAGDVLTNKTLMWQVGEARKQIVNDGHADQYYIEEHHESLVGRELYELVRTMTGEHRMPGQDLFESLGNLPELAKNDPLLDEVRDMLPGTPGRWMKRRKYA